MERTRVNGQQQLELTGEVSRVMNLGSYNYLGFAAHDEYCTPRVKECLQRHGWSMCSPRGQAGTHALHAELERRVAEWLGKEDALVFGMGFATNSMVLPALSGNGSLIISDSLNHASIIAGVRGSGARVKVFEHNNLDSLQHVLRTSIAQGQPRTGRHWRNVMVVVEGIYSMEGDMCPLKEIAALCKQYKAYLYLDEAHSSGAVGKTGRGMMEHSGTDPEDVHILMGTFAKSFGSCGGYIAADKEVIDYLRWSSPASLVACSMSVPAVQQVLGVLDILTGRDGTTRGEDKVEQLRSNSNMMRQGLINAGLGVLGAWDSPVMPVLLFHPAKTCALSRFCLAKGLAVVVVGFPATPLLMSRARICISAAHKPEDLQRALQIIREAADVLMLRTHSELPSSRKAMNLIAAF